MAPRVVRATARIGGRRDQTRRWLPGVVVLLVSPALAAGIVVHPEGLRFQQLSALIWWCSALLWLSGAAMLVLHWRSHRSPLVAWLTSAAIGTGFFVTTFGLMQVTTPGRHPAGSPDGIGIVLAMAVFVMVRLAVARRPFRFPGGPVGMGMAIGFLAITGQSALTAVAPHVGASHAMATLSGALVGLLGMGSVASVLGLPGLGIAARFRIAAAGAAAAVSAALASGYLTRSPMLSLIALGLMCGAGGVFCGAVVSVPTRSRHDEAARAQLFLEGEAVLRFDEQLHELRTGLAGISSAVGLLVRHEAAFDEGERSRLQSMVETELGRLQRLLARREECSPEPLPVDEVLQPLVACRRLAGQDVRLDPSNNWIVADRDLIVEAVTALLLNSERHAPDATVSVTVSSQGGSTRITVADDGPGVPAALRGTLFERGVRASGSPGEGLGLHLARRALRAQGGDLCLDPPPPGGGAVFVVTLPAYCREACA